MDGDKQQKAVVFSGKGKRFLGLSKISKKLSWLKKRPVKWAIGIIIIATCLAAVGYTYIHNKREQAINKDLYSQAAVALDPLASVQLKTVVDKIQKRPHYNSNPNLLYPVVLYEIYIGDEPAASKNFESLKSSYNSKAGFDKAYDGKGVSLSNLETRIKILKLRQEEIKSDTQYL